MTDWKDWKTNGRTFMDLIHPSAGISVDAYAHSGMYDALKLRKILTGKCLEYGCGNGRILRHLQDLDIYGVDLVTEFVEDGISKGIKNLYTLETLNELFDTIYSITVFIHLNDEQTEKALIWIRNHIRENGIAYLQIPLYEKDTPHNGNFMNVRTFTKDKLETLLSKCKLKLVDYKVSKGQFCYENIGEYHYYTHKIIPVV
jgi:cyclopropane fatty-acyl-phospholipid synthase-like methyltransferase